MNPRPVLTIVLALSIGGAFLSLYLIYHHVQLNLTPQYSDPISSFCSISNATSCNIVNSSAYSELFGIPTALLGLIGFIAISSVSFFGLKRDERRATLYLFALSILAAAFSSYLIYVELFVINSICLLCTGAHALGFTIFALP